MFSKNATERRFKLAKNLIYNLYYIFGIANVFGIFKWK